ncbi:preprotein translocase subunit SecE [bacterium]|nr:preprotein translocase subunit SecE [bacterium]
MKKFTIKTKIKIQFVNDIINAFKAVQWPTLKDLGKSLLAVLIISAIIGAYLWVLDSGFEYLRNLILFN